MTRRLKVLSVNFPFKDKSVQQEPDFNTPTALFDFDIVVVRPFALGRPESRGGWGVDWPQFVALKNYVTSKNHDLHLLFESGGVLVLILDVLEKWTCRTGGYSVGELHVLSNYDFFHDRLFDLVGNGTGDRVTIVDPAEPFASVLKSSQVHWTAFMKALPSFYDGKWRIFAKNVPGGVIGATLPMLRGHVVLMPNMLVLNEEFFFDACREYRFRREASPPSRVDEGGVSARRD